MKFCKDCKWVGGPSSKYSEEPTCAHPKNIDPSNGKPKHGTDLQREMPWMVAVVHGLCGKRGRYWEAKA